MASMDVDYCAAVVAIRHEYDTSKKNVNVDSFGVVTSNAKCAITREKNTFATKRSESVCIANELLCISF